MEKQKVFIAVATHKQYMIPKKKGYYPVLVGKALYHQQIPEDYLSDDKGENISDKNPLYCELTGLYWAWKNTESDILGQVHYRRFFSSWERLFRKRKADRLLDESEIVGILEKYDAIVPRKRHYILETIFSHYAHTHYEVHLLQLREIFQEQEPSYVDCFDRMMKRRSAHMYNMFIMKRELAERYCTWLFPVLKELEAKIDYSGYSEYQRRFLGRVGELLLDVWLSQNKIRYCEMPVIYMERVNWLKKGEAFLKAKYFGVKYDRSF